MKSTKQKKEQYNINGNTWTVFDHPFANNPGKIINQGSAFPDDGKGGGITGDCGLCASGTIINKGGGAATEKTVVTYATDHGLCSNDPDAEPEDRGGTSADDCVEVLKGAGIPSKTKSGETLESIAKEVENGKGVIITVTASLYKPEWYGEYSDENKGGHAIVLESPIRNPKTGKITGYVVTDSNGSSSSSATIIVSAEQLEKAYKDRGSVAVVTDDIIW